MATVPLPTHHAPYNGGPSICCCCPPPVIQIRTAMPVTLDGVMTQNEYEEQVAEINSYIMDTIGRSNNYFCTFFTVFILLTILTFGFAVLLLLPCVLGWSIWIACSQTTKRARLLVFLDGLREDPKWKDRGIAWVMQYERITTGHGNHRRTHEVYNFSIEMSAATLERAKSGASATPPAAEKSVWDEMGIGKGADKDQDAIVESKFCSDCFKPLPLDAKFCMKCGKPQE